MKHTANIHLFGATVGSALEQLGFPSPERFITSVSQNVSGWPTWPASYLVDVIDLEYLFHHQTKQTRAKELKQLPERLRYGGPFAKAALKARDDFAAKENIDPETVEPAWPDKPPKY